MCINSKPYIHTIYIQIYKIPTYLHIYIYIYIYIYRQNPMMTYANVLLSGSYISKTIITKKNSICMFAISNYDIHFHIVFLNTFLYH